MVLLGRNPHFFCINSPFFAHEKRRAPHHGIATCYVQAIEQKTAGSCSRIQKKVWDVGICVVMFFEYVDFIYISHAFICPLIHLLIHVKMCI